MELGYRKLESSFNKNKKFSKVLELGAGYGEHVHRVNHQYDMYTSTEPDPRLFDLLSEKMADRKKVVVAQENATNLSFPDDYFDRVIACHLLEHLADPQRVLFEWARICKPGGVLSILLPCDPGLLYQIARFFPRRQSIRLGLEYDYIMATEHVNSIQNLVALIRYHFEKIDENWSPLNIPLMNLNLFYICHVTL